LIFEGRPLHGTSTEKGPLLAADRLEQAYRTALATLLAERTPQGYWTGELSTSALSTATAVSALSLVRRHRPDSPAALASLIDGGLVWLAAHQNADGGWGDTVRSLSNISTSMLGCAAFHLASAAEAYPDCLRKAEAYLQTDCGKTPAEQAEAVRARYGKDRTFAVPILTTCALAGLVDWKEVAPLPFELACLPQAWFRFVRLHVVSYALPALIAIGQAVYHHRPPWNPLAWLVRRLAIPKSLRILQAIQPSSGGYLEAIPLTSFVTLSLASIGQANHPVARKGVEFLVNSVRPDGSWAIDSNLATWVTTLAINALAAAAELEKLPHRLEVRDWLLPQQFTQWHPYTGAEPGGWAWTDLPGGVPDADDTPGALLALCHLDPVPAAAVDPLKDPAFCGLNWLGRLQNTDGGWPTFCRGWGHLPFDRSGADLTAHVLRAFNAWSRQWYGTVPSTEENYLKLTDTLYYGRPETPVDPLSHHLYLSVQEGLAYLARQQRPDGSWLPLWFGNQHAPNDENPTYGTARVLAAYRDLAIMDSGPARRGVAWLLAAQNADGGWGGAAGAPSSVEETALAVEVLLDAGPDAAAAVNTGLAWLVQQVETGGLHRPSPIGFYFAKLWYFERLYPIIFTVAALGRARQRFSPRHDPAPRDVSP
jgi:squalene-hopene/tetraprenyl-beta-curcumene cyclase